MHRIICGLPRFYIGQIRACICECASSLYISEEIIRESKFRLGKSRSDRNIVSYGNEENSLPMLGYAIFFCVDFEKFSSKIVLSESLNNLIYDQSTFL